MPTMAYSNPVPGEIPYLPTIGLPVVLSSFLSRCNKMTPLPEHAFLSTRHTMHAVLLSDLSGQIPLPKSLPRPEGMGYSCFQRTKSPCSGVPETERLSPPTFLKGVSMKTTRILNADEITRILDRLAFQIIERHGDCNQTVLLGIQRRGADLALRLEKMLEEKLGRKIPFGTLDINLYRDDWTSSSTRPIIGESHITTPLDGKKVILVDDVLYTGRTIRAALEAILDYGRPGQVELLVLVDRGHRELPIHGDYVGRTVNTSRTEKVNVLLDERDGTDEVTLESAE